LEGRREGKKERGGSTPVCGVLRKGEKRRKRKGNPIKSTSLSSRRKEGRGKGGEKKGRKAEPLPFG